METNFDGQEPIPNCCVLNEQELILSLCLGTVGLDLQVSDEVYPHGFVTISESVPLGMSEIRTRDAQFLIEELDESQIDWGAKL